MKVEYGLNDYQKRIIFVVGCEKELTVADLFIYLDEFTDEYLHLFYEMPEEFRKLLKEQIHAKNSEKKKAYIYLENLKSEQNYRFQSVSDRPLIPSRLPVPDSFASHEFVSRDDLKDILHELQGLSFIGLVRTCDSVSEIRSSRTTICLTEYGMDIHQRIIQGRNPIIRRPKNMRNKVFIASAIGREDTDILFNSCLSKTCQKCGYDAVRIDITEPPLTITQGIIEGITEAVALIADLTYARPSVYFEVGFAQGLGVPFLLTCRKDHYRGIDDSLKIHFDLEQYKISFWEKTGETKLSWEKNMSPFRRLPKLIKYKS